jgi:hypothetical protein
MIYTKRSWVKNLKNPCSNFIEMIPNGTNQGWVCSYLNKFNASMKNDLFIFRMHFSILNIIFSIHYKNYFYFQHE